MKKILLLIIPFLFLGAFCTGPEVEKIEELEKKSAVGSNISFIKDNQLTVFNSATNKETELTTSQDFKYAPAFFPSRFEVMFLKSEEPYTQFIKYDLKTGNQEFIYASKNEPEYYEFSSNGKYILFIENEELFLLNLNTKEASKIATDVKLTTWSPDSKSFIYLDTDGELFLLEFNVHEVVGKAESIYKGPIDVPVFLEADKLIFEECTDKKCKLYEFDLYKREKSREIISTEFTRNGNSKLLLSPNKNYLAYTKIDPHTDSSVINVISYPKGDIIAKYDYAQNPFWLKDKDSLIFSKKELDEFDNFRENTYLVNIGEEPYQITVDSISPVTTAAYMSNL